MERQPKLSGSQTSSNQLELPREPHRSRRNESSSLKGVPTTRKPRPVHRSATDTMRGSGTDTDDRGESRAGYNTSVLESNSEEESSTAKLTRRASVLVGLFVYGYLNVFDGLDRFIGIISTFEQLWGPSSISTFKSIAR